MRSILSKIPGFIYSLILLCTLLISLVSYVLNNLDPDSNSSKLLFGLILFITSLFTIPTVRTLFLLAEDDDYIDFRTRFRSYFAENILFSFILGILIVLKTYGFLNFSTFIGLILIYIGTNYGYKKLRKPRRIKRI